MKDTKKKNNKLDFSGQIIFVGIDVHKKFWAIVVILNGMVVYQSIIVPRPLGLKKLLTKKYPGATYYSVYEAGFCGFRIHRELIKLGIHNIVVNPGDIPTRSKEKRTKNDRNDAKKLARELSVGHLEGIYVPTEKAEALRTLVRLRRQLVTDKARQKNRIKSLLLYLGLEVNDEISEKNWSGKYIEALRNLQINQAEAKVTLIELLDSLESIEKKTTSVTKQIEKFIKEDEEASKTVKLLQSVPGIGFVLATALYSEIMDINRFSRFDSLASYVGFAPAFRSSGEKEYNLGLSKQRNKYIRNFLIEASWVSIRKDRALQMSYGKLRHRGVPPQKAIIRIAKKLLRRIRAVWKNQQPYVCAIVVK